MISAQAQFKSNLARVIAMGGLANAIRGITTPIIDVSDLWRSQVVLAVSALDHFIHEIARLGMIECAKGLRPKTDAYSRFYVSVAAAEAALGGVGHEIWIGESVREKHSWQSFQDPERLADAIRLISPVRLWEEVGRVLALPPADIKTRLKLIVDRRNKIAHEADMDPANPPFRWPIDQAMVNDTVAFVERLGNAIYSVAVY